MSSDIYNQNRVGDLYAGTMPLAIIAWIFVGLRFYSRYTSASKLWWDDWTILMAVVCFHPLVSACLCLWRKQRSESLMAVLRAVFRHRPRDLLLASDYLWRSGSSYGCVRRPRERDAVFLLQQGKKQTTPITQNQTRPLRLLLGKDS